MFLFASIFLLGFCHGQNMPLPFTRELMEMEPLQSGNDVLIAQTLLLRDAVVGSLVCDGYYGADSAAATKAFQQAHDLSDTGILDDSSALLLLDLHSADGYKDSMFTAASLGYLYKIHLPVHVNRSIETMGTLYDAENNVILQFHARSHGHRDDGSEAAWPDYGNGDYGVNEFTSNGATVTGLYEIDLNSPEPNPTLYGPWPVNRFVRGLEGNALLMLPNIRDGILLHTGNWTTDEVDWTPEVDMPNSSGCVHAHPTEVQAIYEALLSLGVKVNDNPFSGKNYPYQPQGVAVVELID